VVGIVVVVHSLFIFCVSWKWLLFVLFVLPWRVVFAVTSDHGIEKKELNRNRESGNYSGGGKQPSSVML
jgi:hypothetical protein